MDISVTGLTRIEVIGNALLFLIAGFQTTAETINFLFYEMAVNPDCQEKVIPLLLSLIFAFGHLGRR